MDLPRRVLTALALLLATGPPAGAALSAAEAGLAAWIETHEEDGRGLLRRLVDVNSGTMNLEGVTRVGTMLAAELEGLGFETRWIDGRAFGRAGHLVATRRGGGPRVLLIGHLDTVFEPDSPFQTFEPLGGDRARGPGAIDMKGGDVVMLLALGALDAGGVLDDLDLTVVLTGDEERSGRPVEASRRVLREAGERADFALGFEDGDGDPATAVVSRRGATEWRLDVSGTPAHSSQIFQPEVGAGAIYEAARILDGFREALAQEEDLTYNPGLVLGGTEVDFDSEQNRGTAFGKRNVVAASAVVAGDVRALTPQQLDRALEAMRGVVGDHLPGTHAELEISNSYPPMAASPGNLRLLALYDAASRDLGHGPVTAVDPRNAGAADVSFVAADVDAALDGLGLMGTGGHTGDETADLTTLVSQAQRAAVLLFRLSRGAFGD
ncbi:MAG: M20/M25/M40 family metallo-hydrolase [Thermoanaerobaculia bacterium]